MREEKNEMLTWYLGVLAPIENLWVGREGMPVDDGGGEEKEGVHVMGHVDLIITLSNQCHCVESDRPWLIVITYLHAFTTMISRCPFSLDLLHRRTFNQRIRNLFKLRRISATISPVFKIDVHSIPPHDVSL